MHIYCCRKKKFLHCGQRRRQQPQCGWQVGEEAFVSQVCWCCIKKKWAYMVNYKAIGQSRLTAELFKDPDQQQKRKIYLRSMRDFHRRGRHTSDRRTLAVEKTE